MNQTDYIGYEYKTLSIPAAQASMYLDGYENFGWQPDGNRAEGAEHDRVTLYLKRDRKILNKAELTRLQQHFEACAREIQGMERAIPSRATVWALATGLFGTAFMAGSTFAVTHDPPVIWLCVLLAIPGFLGWVLAPFVHRGVLRRQTARLQPLIEEKYEELYAVCEKGHMLLL